MTKDLTSGSPLKKVLSFAIPLYFGNILQQLYTLINTIIVGRFLGTDALAAVGLTASINFLILGFCVGVATGFSIPIAQAFGSKDYAELKRLTGNITTLSIIISAIFTIVTAVLCRPILLLMNTPESILQDAYNYLLVLFLGVPTVFAYNALSSLMRSLGDSKTPLIILLLSSLISIGLAYVFIDVFHWGVGGAAWAIFISQALSSIGCFVVIVKKFPLLHFDKKDLKLQTKYVSQLLKIGIPMGLQFSITGFGSAVLQSAVNQLGSVIVAAVSSGGRVMTLISCAYDTLGSTMATYAGQNVGAGKIHRLRKGVHAAVYISLVFTVFAISVCFIFGRPLAMMFISDSSSQDIVDYTYQFLKVSSLFYVPLALVNILRLVIQGLGYGKLAMMSGVCEMVARVIVGNVFVPLFGFAAACFANPSAWVLADIFLIPAYFIVMKRIERTFPERENLDSSPPTIDNLVEPVLLPEENS
ncbi:MATE family efflux transporter [Scatolibacter rhodanostii]|uniref:MATE family efflux transporter n=1 Tax=Scatolibacter rhodanostii TaxID=2014781 RepID=UPI000C0776E8|nr:MATE family efflux transporter [Scatolibacter rhodanostii]